MAADGGDRAHDPLDARDGGGADDGSESGARGETLDRALEQRIRAVAAPVARTGFRAETRAAFVQSASRVPYDQRTPTHVSTEFEQRLIATALAPAARPEFRAELRGRFVGAVDFGRQAGGDRVEPTGLPGGDRHGATGDSAVPAPVNRLRQGAILALALAAAVVVTLFVPNDPVWKVRDLSGDGPIEVAGLSLGATERGRIGVELTRGAEIASHDREMEIELEDWMRVRVRSGTRLELSPLPAISTAEPILIRLDQGEFFLETRPSYPGNPIVIETEHASITVTGTILGVRVDERGTCTCVARGSVWVDDLVGGEPTETVESLHSYLVFDGAVMPAKLLDFEVEGEPAHRAHTALLQDFAGGS